MLIYVTVSTKLWSNAVLASSLGKWQCRNEC